MVDVIRTESLSKTYGDGTAAVRDVNLNVRRGEIFGFLGPNGAGKTTTISILTTVLRSTNGYAEIDGIDVDRHPDRIRRKIGLVFQKSSADETLTGRENLEIAAGLYGLAPAESRSRIREILGRLDLTEAADRLVRGYSGGMRRRLEIAAGIIHSPEILFLDEPTLGLDPQGRAQFWEYIRDLRAHQQMTVFLTTHYLDEADQLSDRISIIDHGSILRTGTPAELKDALGGGVVDLRTHGDGPEVAQALGRLDGVVVIDRLGNDGVYRLGVRHLASVVPSIVRACDAAGIGLDGLSTRSPTLEEVFLTMTGRPVRDMEGPTPNGPPHESGAPAGGR